jgi:hypothetical protein
LPGFDKGERFRLTILGPTGASPNDCGILPLQAGTSFELVAGDSRKDAEQCEIRSAASVVPARFVGMFRNCVGTLEQLGLSCSAQLTPTCVGSAALGVGPTIHRSDVVIEVGSFGISWAGDTCLKLGCTDLYEVRIERLGKTN